MAASPMRLGRPQSLGQRSVFPLSPEPPCSAQSLVSGGCRSLGQARRVHDGLEEITGWPEKGQLQPVVQWKGGEGDSLDLVPRGHPSEPLGEWRGCTRRLWFQGEVIGTHCVPFMSNCSLNNPQVFETMWTQPMTLLLQMSDGARIGGQAFKGKKSRWLREK